MGIAWEHVNGLDVVAIDLPFKHTPQWVVEIALLDESVTFDDDELLPFGVVPMLTFGDAWLADVDGDLTCVEGVHQLCEAATLIDVHLEREGGLLVGEIAEVGAVELLGEGRPPSDSPLKGKSYFFERDLCGAISLEQLQ